MAGFESTMLHKVAPQPFASQLPRESEALCRFRVDYRYWWPSPVSRGESHEDSLQAGPPTIDRGGEQVRNKRERKSWPICAPIVDRVPPRKFSRESFQGGKEKIPVFFNRFEIRYVLLVGRALWDAADSRVNRIPWRRGWKTNRKGRALMECYGLGIWILIRCEQGNWAESNFEGTSQQFVHVSSPFFFYYVNSWYQWWMIRGVSKLKFKTDGILTLANLLFHRWSKRLVTRKINRATSVTQSVTLRGRPTRPFHNVLSSLIFSQPTQASRSEKRQNPWETAKFL